MATGKTLLQEVQELNEKKEYQAVIDLLPDAVLQAENSADLYAEKSDAYYELDAAVLCEAMADKALAIDAEHAKANNFKGNVYDDLKAYDKAIACYKKAIAANPKYKHPYNGLGIVYSNKGEYDAAIKCFQKAIELNPKFENPYNGLGNIFYEKGEYEKAIGWYQKAIELNPQEEGPYNGLGNIYYDKGEYDTAIRCYQKAIELNPQEEYPYNGLGNVYYEKGEHDTAIGWYQKAIELNPQEECPYNGLGNVYNKKGENNTAIEYYQKAIAVNPNYDNPYNGLGSVYFDKGEYDTAIGWFQKAIELNPKFESVYYNMALVYEALGDHAKALTDYEKYIELTKDNADYFTDRAMERVAELKKTVKSVQYSEIVELVTQIKNLLLFSDGCITHYTGLSTAKALVLNSSPFRLSEGAFLNDTSEGRELFTYLNFHVKALKSHDMEALTFTPKPFIGSFVAETKHDDLTLWRMYGKEEKEEAKGCAITLHQQQLVEAIQNKVAPSSLGGLSIKNNDAFSFYRVAYKSHDNQFILPGADEGIVEKLNGYMQDLAAKIKSITTEKKKTTPKQQDILERLNEIAYLFKTIEYQHEQELRLVIDGIGFPKQLNINATPPRVYIELVDIRPLIQKITIGPKVERGDEWAAAFYYSLDKDGLRPEICISHLPYK